MEIVFLDRKTLGFDIDLSRFNELGNVTIYDTTTQDETLNRVQNADIVVTNKVVIDKDIIENTNIKLICVSATGMNNIDLESAKLHNIPVKNVAGYSTASVSQVTISLVLDFIQKLDFYKEYVKTNQWEKSDIFTNIDEPFYELENKTWGIIGLGSIGTRVANIAKSFGCNVNYYSTTGKNNNTNFKKVEFEYLLKNSDIITIHSALTETTYNMINSSNIDLIKDGAILINVGRGGIINEEALAKRIDSNKALFCGLDVLEVEPIRKDNPLKFVQKSDRITILPHIAWSSIESREKLIKLLFDNIKEFVL